MDWERKPGANRDAAAPATALGLIGGALLAAIAAFSVRAAEVPSRAVLPQRIIYCPFNILNDSKVEEFLKIFERAKKAGYTHVLLDDTKFGILGTMPPKYFENARTVVKKIRDLDMKIMTYVFCLGGDAEYILSLNPNLAEGFPVEDAPFVVRDGKAVHVTSPGIASANSDFEQVKGDEFIGWGNQDKPGQITFPDRETVKSGKVSCRLQDVGKHDPEHGHGRLRLDFKAPHHRALLASFWIKTEGFSAANRIKAGLYDGARELIDHALKVKPTQDWTQYRLLFNSMKCDDLHLYLGVWGGKDGKMWIDDVRIQEPGLLNALRREGTPLKVAGEDGTVYEEGKDFAPVQDPKLVSFDADHDGPPIALTKESRIQEGARLKVSFTHAFRITGSAFPCLSSPEFREMLVDQARRVRELLSPDGWLMAHDEMRVMNWCPACAKRNITPGKMLAENVADCFKIIRELDPQKPVLVWHDMFDPNHNARDDYYLVNGSLKGSWEGLPKDVVIATWRGKSETLKFFADRGHAQVLCGYYDKNSREGVKKDVAMWLEAAKGIPNLTGICYTTWRGNYEFLEAYMEEVNAQVADWVK
jgi:hypothetical protein